MSKDLFGFRENIRVFGGSLLKGNPRDRRPVSIRQPMHLVMRSSKAKDSLSFLHPSRARKLYHLIYSVAEMKGIKIYRYANAGNHFHLVVKAKTRLGFLQFLKAISGLIARKVLKVERGAGKGIKFWDARPFTRILEWGRDFRVATTYVLQNELEAAGIIPFRARVKRARSP